VKKIIILSIIASFFVFAERSVYGATSSYVSPKKNKKEIILLRDKINSLKQEIEGLKSVVNGLGSTVNQQEQQSHSNSDDSKLLHDLAAMIDKINTNYVSKDDLTKELAGKKVSGSTKTQHSSIHNPNKKINNTLEKASSSALYSKGVRLFRQRKYSAAKLRFVILKKRSYKKASTDFYLGEISYNTHKYQDAIEYYKLSAQFDDNANFMDKLLLHTGLSLEKTGDKSQAKRFFQAIVDGYPKSSSAKVAKRHL